MNLFIGIFVICLTAFCGAFSQNLITNPGFENDLTGWNTFWSRDAGAGSLIVVAAPVHSGAKAAQVKHWGTLDWSVSPSAVVTVKPGQLYEYSAWIRTDTLPSGASAEISVVLYDSMNNAVDWSYAAKQCTLSTGFTQYSTRFLIPTHIATIRPRLMGNDTCGLYADDFSLTLVDSVPAGYARPYVLQNANIKVIINPISFDLTLQSTATSRTYAASGVGVFQTSSVDSFPDSLVFHCTYLPDNWPVAISMWLEGPALGIRLSGTAASPMSSDLDFPGPIAAQATDFLIIPKGTGVICPAQGAPGYMSRYYWIGMHDWQSDLCFTGVTDKTSGYMITSDDPWFTRVSFTPAAGTTANAPHITLEAAKHLFSKDRTLYYTLIDTGGYAAMCTWYRSHVEKLGYARTFAQKASVVPNINRMKGAVDFWILGKGFWLPTADFFRNLIDKGMDQAIFSGNFSNAVTDTLNSLGFLTSEYDCYCDAYPPGNAGYQSDGYNTDAIVNEDGSYMNGWLAYLSGGGTLQAQEVCAASHCKYAIPRIAAERATKHLNCRFIDVELAMGLEECWSQTHPVNRYTDALAREKLFDTLRTTFNLVLGGEQARDFAFPFVDYGEGTMSPCPATNAGYDWMTPASPDSDFVHYDVNPAIRVPLHGLIYHDVHVPTWYTGDGVSRVPAFWDAKDLFNILYASMPLFMPPDTGYWKANFERFLTSYNLVSAVTRSVGFARMTGHSFITPDAMVQQTAFDDGWTVTVNFDSAKTYALGPTTLASRGFYATDGSQEVYRLSTGSGTIACAKLSDRLFVNGYGASTEAGGVKSAGAVFLRKDSAWVHLAFIGSQSFVDVNPGKLPWPLAGMRVFTNGNSQEITLAPQTDGSFRINRLAGIDNYRIEGVFSSASPSTKYRQAPSLLIRPIRSRQVLVIFRDVPNTSTAVSIFDFRGRLVQELAISQQNNSSTTSLISKPLKRGIYLVRCKSGQSMVTQKFAITN
ncbi:MAG TPA: glycoside hydrolase [Chitinivibrionales bacterium]|nr:glycoside hydrolase [Chitinivibrionales bacterium]